MAFIELREKHSISDREWILEGSRANTTNKPFFLSLIGGTIIVAGSTIDLTWLFSGFLQVLGPANAGELRSLAITYSQVLAGLFALALASGIAIILAAITLKMNPTYAKGLEKAILALSLVSVLGMGGFMFGALLGIAGGASAPITVNPIKRPSVAP